MEHGMETGVVVVSRVYDLKNERALSGSCHNKFDRYTGGLYWGPVFLESHRMDLFKLPGPCVGTHLF